ncbi:hypothetical protein ZEAMMB73_Zm00001d040520 [Zea mays]|uniref:non-specific serine/threonine protein kinase n=1 Tax=Zea mays TaxID=4577 RepID=A0A1D6MR64_MAIZE|nr:hypothetical protein ZEAMMB73_Zm00001d040520 [Zea mays]
MEHGPASEDDDDGGLVHGDLTTSNMMIKNSNNQLVALILMINQMEKILAAYRKASKQWCSTQNKLAQGMAWSCWPLWQRMAFVASCTDVSSDFLSTLRKTMRQRGRKRTMVG